MGSTYPSKLLLWMVNTVGIAWMQNSWAGWEIKVYFLGQSISIQGFQSQGEISCLDFRFNFPKAVDGVDEPLMVISLKFLAGRWGSLGCEIWTLINNPFHWIILPKDNVCIWELEHRSSFLPQFIFLILALQLPYLLKPTKQNSKTTLSRMSFSKCQQEKGWGKGHFWTLPLESGTFTYLIQSIQDNCEGEVPPLTDFTDVAVALRKGQGSCIWKMMEHLG